ncbi:MAG TPA: hypothetical protein VFL03_03860 [Candidatus Limnocylindrales bacterium]|nr:hypothetical protein [Candidatus Limnocylindrales bacterium]
MERPVEPSAAADPVSAAPVPSASAPTELTDPRVITILSTEHWSLLTARSLVYNETFSRGGMFLTLLSASLVALGFVYQGGGGGPQFLTVVIAILALDLFVGLATLGRIIGASTEEFRALQAMARIRHAYLDIAPFIAPYLSTATTDDSESVLEVYGQGLDDASALLNLGHGLTTMPGMISVLNVALIGGLVGAVTVALGGEAQLAIALGIGAGLISLVGMMIYGVRTFSNVNRFTEVRFPRPGLPVNPPR